jgi:cobaltochelatase CobT
MPPNDNPLESFRQVLTGAARAIAREPEVELGFSAEAPSAQGKNIKVPMPGRTLPEREVAEAAGFADAAALKIRHHDTALTCAARLPTRWRARSSTPPSRRAWRRSAPVR